MEKQHKVTDILIQFYREFTNLLSIRGGVFYDMLQLDYKGFI